MWKRITYPFLVFLMGGVSAFALDPPSLPPRTPIVLEPTTPISFGNIVAPSGSNGRVTIATNGSITKSGDIDLLGGTVQPAQFEFRLMPGRTVYVHAKVNEVAVNGIVNGSTATPTITFDYPTFELEGGTVETLADGSIRFKSLVGSNRIHRLKMGGRLNLNGISNPAATYNGNIQIVIEAY